MAERISRGFFFEPPEFVVICSPLFLWEKSDQKKPQHLSAEGPGLQTRETRECSSMSFAWPENIPEVISALGPGDLFSLFFLRLWVLQRHAHWGQGKRTNEHVSLAALSPSTAPNQEPTVDPLVCSSLLNLLPERCFGVGKGGSSLGLDFLLDFHD